MYSTNERTNTLEQRRRPDYIGTGSGRQEKVEDSEFMIHDFLRGLCDLAVNGFDFHFTLHPWPNFHRPSLLLPSY
jgi:hypothetical protein